jgi:hypothetical protein
MMSADYFFDNHISKELRIYIPLNFKRITTKAAMVSKVTVQVMRPEVIVLSQQRPWFSLMQQCDPTISSFLNFPTNTLVITVATMTQVMKLA